MKVALVAAVVVVLLASGCTPPPLTDSAVSPEDEGDQAPERPSYDPREWECVSQGDAGDVRLLDGSNSWTTEGGSMVTVRATSLGAHGEPGLPTRGEAFADAVAAGAEAALDLLERRGVGYAPERRSEIVESVRRSAASGAEVAFPRIRASSTAWQECVSRARADTSWRATVFVEYPVGHLRGDANNVHWSRSRASNEARVLRESAKEHLSRGRLFAGLIDAARVAATVRATGVPLDRPAGLVDDELANSLAWATGAARVVNSLIAVPVDDVEVIDIGSSSDVVMEFDCSYEWEGQRVPARGVPVRFVLTGAAAVLDGEPVTDEAGKARCRVLSVLGEPGECEVGVYLDEGGVGAALASLRASGEPAARSAGGAPTHEPLASRKVHLVAGTHAVSVCASFDAGAGDDAAQALGGFRRRMEAGGFTVDECSPNVDVIVTGTLEKSSTEGIGAAEGHWGCQVSVIASAFDQRTASSLGKFTVSARETSEEGARAAEVLALKEAGRLVAVYFEGRMLAGGPIR